MGDIDFNKLFAGTASATTGCDSKTQDVNIEELQQISKEFREMFLDQARAVANLVPVIIVSSDIVRENQMIVHVSRQIFKDLTE